MDKIEWYEELSKFVNSDNVDAPDRAKLWKIAIGLQDVDGLKPSKYLLDTAKEHIEGRIGIEEVEQRINKYYKILNSREQEKADNNEEADKVSVRITEILSDKSFNFNPVELINIHKKLFSDIFEFAGKIRDYNFTKDEWVLDGDTVIYASYETIMPSLQYDFEQEKNFSYKDITFDDAIKHLCRFTSNIWQVHPFCEGNTRTTAVFMIKYLRTFGFDINDDVFAKHSWYFRNSLVRANYKKFASNIFEDISFLEKFFYNLLAGTNYELRNRYTHISYQENVNNEKVKNDVYTLEEQAIINIISSNANIKQEEIAKIIGKSLRTVKTRMNEMQDKGLITRKNGKRSGEWIIL